MSIPTTYRGFRVTRGDATGEQLAILVPTGYRVLHLASAADEGTDWNVSNPTHPTFYVHSETTPATDYMAFSHDATSGIINVASGTLALQIDGTTVLTLASTGYTVPDDILLGIGTSNDARFSWDTTDANANELLLQMPAGGAVNVPVLAIGQSIESVDLGLFDGVVDPTIAIFGVGAVTTGVRLRVYKARGTIAAPTVVTTGDDLFSIDAYGAVAAGEYVQAARILFEMTGTIATTRGPGVITFQTATDAAPSVLTSALSINPAQLVRVHNSLVVNQRTAANYAVAGTTPIMQVQDTGAPGAVFIAIWNNSTTHPRLFFAKSRGSEVGTFAIITTGDTLGAIEAFGDDGVDFNSNSNASAAIRFVSVGTIGADRIAAEIRFLTATDAAPSVLTERFRIDEAGVIQAGIYTNANVTAAGAGIFAGGIAFTDVANAWIDDATQGSGTTTHYIGNQTITTASDVRVKDDIVDWDGNALRLLRQANLKEFTYNLPGGGPQDAGYGPNARGRYLGLLAQETIEWAPWVINAGAGKDCPQCSNGLPCKNEAHSFWHVEYDHLVPLVVKGIQELDTRLSAIEEANLILRQQLTQAGIFPGA